MDHQLAERLLTELRPHPRNEKTYGKVSVSDKEVESVRQFGILQPVVISQHNTILAGHRRCKAADLAGLKSVPVIVRHVADELDELEILIHSNKQREKSNEVLGREAKCLLEIEAEKAKRRQSESTIEAGKASAAARKADQSNAVENFPPRSKPTPKPDAGKSRDKVGEALGVSGKTAVKAAEVVERIDQLAEAGHVEKAEEIRETLNTKSVSAAHKAAYKELDLPREPGLEDEDEAKADEEKKRPKNGSQVVNWQNVNGAFRTLAQSVDNLYKAYGFVDAKGHVKNDPAYKSMHDLLEEYLAAFKSRYKEITKENPPGLSA